MLLVKRLHLNLVSFYRVVRKVKNSVLTDNLVNYSCENRDAVAVAAAAAGDVADGFHYDDDDDDGDGDVVQKLCDGPNLN